MYRFCGTMPVMVGWLANFFANTATQIMGVTNMMAALIMAIFAALLGGIYWHRQRRKAGKTAVEAWHLLVIGIVGTWLFMTMALAAAGWAVWNGQGFNASFGMTQKKDDGPLRWIDTLFLEGGPPRGQNVFSLRIKGVNAAQKEVKIKSADIVSAINGTRLQLEIAAQNEIVPIDKIELIPPGAPIELVAKFGLPDPNAAGKILGLEPKVFLETWRQFFINVEDDTRKYRLIFNEGSLAPFFPGMVGPHVTKKAN